MASGPLDKKKLRKAWATVATESGERAHAFALVDKGRFLAANASLSELLGSDPTGVRWDALFTTDVPNQAGASRVTMSGGRELDVWATSSSLGLALGFSDATDDAPTEGDGTGPDWGSFALELTRCSSAADVDLVCQNLGPNLVGARGFVAIPSTNRGEVVVRCYWPVDSLPPTSLALDASNCDALRKGGASRNCRHCYGLVCTPVFVKGSLVCVVGCSGPAAEAELFSKLVGASLARFA